MDYKQAINYLDCQPGATANEIKASYRALAKKYHPDTGGTEKQFIFLQQAKDIALRGEQKGIVVDYNFTDPVYRDSVAQTAAQNYDAIITVIRVLLLTFFAISTLLILPWADLYIDLQYKIQSISKTTVMLLFWISLFGIKLAFDVYRNPANLFAIGVIIATVGVALSIFWPDIISHYHAFVSAINQVNSVFNNL